MNALIAKIALKTVTSAIQIAEKGQIGVANSIAISTTSISCAIFNALKSNI